VLVGMKTNVLIEIVGMADAHATLEWGCDCDRFNCSERRQVKFHKRGTQLLAAERMYAVNN